MSPMKIHPCLGSVGAGPVPALAPSENNKSQITDHKFRKQPGPIYFLSQICDLRFVIFGITPPGSPRVAPLQSFFIRSGEPQDHGNLVVSVAKPNSPPGHKDTKEFCVNLRNLRTRDRSTIVLKLHDCRKAGVPDNSVRLIQSEILPMPH